MLRKSVIHATICYIFIFVSLECTRVKLTKIFVCNEFVGDIGQ